jgi:hypothetical protein
MSAAKEENEREKAIHRAPIVMIRKKDPASRSFEGRRMAQAVPGRRESTA